MDLTLNLLRTRDPDKLMLQKDIIDLHITDLAAFSFSARTDLITHFQNVTQFQNGRLNAIPLLRHNIIDVYSKKWNSGFILDQDLLLAI
jgi:hypothetical protein